MASSSRAPAKKISKLDPTVVNRIAAGEVIHRPSSALKELLENSIDAGSTAITVVVKDGGLKLLSIQDDGHGIRKADLGIVCERFTTSKLTSFDDLKTIGTFGFRGEALASISHVAHLSILSMTPGAPCAYRAAYADGKLVAPRPGASSKPQPCAGVPGTQITVEDLFYNVATRRKALKSLSAEYTRILDVVSRYAVHYGSSGVGFTCKKQGSASADLHTTSKSSCLKNIRSIYGRRVAQELLQLDVVVPPPASSSSSSSSSAPSMTNTPLPSNAPTFEFHGFVSNANWSQKSSTFILFINNRLVESSLLKRTIDAVYADLLPRNAHPFAYLAITLPPQSVDVNVHPTKKEVLFLHEDVIASALTDALQSLLANANASRTFYTQATLPVQSEFDDGGAASSHGSSMSSSSSSSSSAVSRKAGRKGNLVGDEDDDAFDEDGSNKAAGGGGGRKIDGGASKKRKQETSAAKAPAPNKMTRIDARDPAGRLEAFLVPMRLAKEGEARSGPSTGAGMMGGAAGNGGALSIGGDGKKRNGREENQGADNGAGEAEDDEGDHVDDDDDDDDDGDDDDGDQDEVRPCQLTSVRNLREQVALSCHDGLAKTMREHAFVGMVDHTLALIQHETRLFLVNHQKLSEAFFYQKILDGMGRFRTIRIAEPVDIKTLLLHSIIGRDQNAVEAAVGLLRSHGPMLTDYFSISFDDGGALASLPEVVKDHLPESVALPAFLLALSRVDYSAERTCLQGISRCLAQFYCRLPHDNEAEASKVLQHIISPGLRKLRPPRSLARDGSVVEVAKLENLYKVFERC